MQRRCADRPISRFRRVENFGSTLGGPWAKGANGRSSSRPTSARSSSKWAWAENSSEIKRMGREKDLFCSIRNANGIDVATAGQPDISALIDKGFSKKEGAKLVVRYWLCERTNKPLHSRGPPHMLLRIAVKGENAPSGSAAAVG
jgi:hypothetical protein